MFNRVPIIYLLSNREGQYVFINQFYFVFADKQIFFVDTTDAWADPKRT